MYLVFYGIYNELGTVPEKNTVMPLENSPQPNLMKFSVIRKTYGMLYISSYIMAHSEISGLVCKLLQAEMFCIYF